MLVELVQHLQGSAHAQPIAGDDGRSFLTKPVHLPPAEPTASPLKVTTLGAVVGYITANRDRLTLADLVLIVDSPSQVSLLGPIAGRHRLRESFLVANAELPKLSLETWIDREVAQIVLSSRFAPGHDLDDALRLISQVESGVVRQAGDDGVQQQVTVKRGAATKDRELVRRSYVLAPHRTFAEVSQPASPFVLRIRGTEDSVEVGLFEADGGAWRLEARRLIGEWLHSELGGSSGQVEVLW